VVVLTGLFSDLALTPAAGDATGLVALGLPTLVLLTAVLAGVLFAALSGPRGVDRLIRRLLPSAPAPELVVLSRLPVPVPQGSPPARSPSTGPSMRWLGRAPPGTSEPHASPTRRNPVETLRLNRAASSRP